MRINRIKTVMLHSWYHLTHSMETFVDNVWFPIIGFLVFGIVANYLGGSEQARFIILGSIFWVSIEVVQYALSVAAMWEIWSQSFSSLFITPLTLPEYLIGNMVTGMLKAAGVFLFLALSGIVMFNFSVFEIGPMLIIYFLELVMFGWAAGMLVLSLIFKYGTNIQSLSWSLIFLVQPLAAVFYPLSILPEAIQKISLLFPPTYIFETIRGHVAFGVVNTQYLVKATLMNIVLLALAFMTVNRMMRKAKQKGSFVRLETS